MMFGRACRPATAHRLVGPAPIWLGLDTRAHLMPPGAPTLFQKLIRFARTLARAARPKVIIMWPRVYVPCRAQSGGPAARPEPIWRPANGRANWTRLRARQTRMEPVAGEQVHTPAAYRAGLFGTGAPGN